MPNGQEYIKLEQRLVLLAWLNDRFGYKSNFDLLSDMCEAAEGFDASGRSFVYHRLIGRGDNVKIPQSDLARYDDNIRDHLRAINHRRPEPITLRYFQYLSVLYTEIFLDAVFNRRGWLLNELNGFVEKRNPTRGDTEVKDEKFIDSDLNKLAYWMATGGGKTLIMHLNYRQFLHYNSNPLDNILLITPNEGMTHQHIEEMTASNIPCRRFDLNETSIALDDENAVRVIEITKLVEDKKGGGLSVPVEAFEGNNLIFVDEGHKGSSSTVNEKGWRYLRGLLDRTGFTFEYSATFGQALTASRNDELTAEYGKAIIFDYSYRYFHGDGFGKDFHILNLQEESTEENTNLLLLGNLLSFYEQKLIYNEHEPELRPYNLDRPLWIFVGKSVNAVYTEKRKKRSDVLTVIRFLHKFLGNSDNWAIDAIDQIIGGRSGLLTPDGRDLFKDKFAYLRGKNHTPVDTYNLILDNVFGTLSRGALRLCDLRGHAGEMGLKATGADDYFGLIYIGDPSEFKKIVEADDAGIPIEEDVVAESLFKTINEPGTSVDILIGARKFVEGWSSWRVSNMGLLNIGTQEGSQIIQLFGRGVRLLGKDFSLKRSVALDGEHPEYIRYLETLNIFAVRANYMVRFREYLEKEGVETEGNIDLPLPIRPNREFLGKRLLVPRASSGESFEDSRFFMLEPDPTVQVLVDLSLKVQSLTGTPEGVSVESVAAGYKRPIPGDSINIIDWEKAYLDLLEFKEEKGLRNMAIKSDTPKRIITHSNPHRLYSVIAQDEIVRPSSFAGTELLQEAVQTILRKYAESYYRKYREKWDEATMEYRELNENDPNFQDYTVKIPRSKTELIENVRRLIEEGERVYREETTELPNIHFDRHLYQPLLIEQGDNIKSTPSGLKESERKLLDDMRDYCRAERGGSLADKEVFLLRNLSRGKGIGFFETRGFYPDFILWVKEKDRQRIVFIEPHGMVFSEPHEHNDKAQLYKRLPGLADEIGKRSETGDISLDSFIISFTEYEDMCKRADYQDWTMQQFAEEHILFFKRENGYDYIREIFR